MSTQEYFQQHYQKNRAEKLGAARAWYDRNKDRRKAYRASRREKDKAWKKNWDLKRNYGITLSERDQLLAEQNGVCAICGGDKGTHKDWHVDHCHHTGRIRGILCGECNHMLGKAKDDPERLRAAARYLEK